MKPILKYRGGKLREIPNFAKYIPRNFNRYIEPFFGGGAVYFYLEPERAIINDMNKALMSFYLDVRDSYSRLRSELGMLQEQYDKNQKKYLFEKIKSPNNRVPNANEELYYSIREKFNHPIGDLLDGTIYFFVNKTAYSGMIRYNRNGEYNVPFGRYANFNTELITTEHHKLLQGADLHIGDYKKIFNLAKKDDFIFLDPPYDCVFNDYGNLSMTHGFDEKEHRRLAKDFKMLDTRAMMIIGKTKLTEELYKDYICDEYFKSYAVNIRNRFKNESMHIVVKNY